MAVEDDPHGAARAGAERADAGHRLALSPMPGAAEGLWPGPRGHLDLLLENAGDVPWCGPAAVALATGRSYAAACDLLRGIAPDWYPQEGPIVTAYWRDLLAALRSAEVPYEPLALPDPAPSLLRLVRGGLAAGWYLLRVTDHFLLLRSHGFGLALLHDNRHTAVPLSGRIHGRRKVSHAVRLLGGPMLPV